MNTSDTPGAILRLLYRYVLRIRRLLGKQTCRTFGRVDEKVMSHTIGKIYVINLDRQPSRWRQVRQELEHILDAFGVPLTARTTRVPAVDARQFGNTIDTGDVDPIYTLGDQLFVDPRRVLPSRLDLDDKIEMSRQEIAVALSHIKVWRQVASGHHEYALILEDDVHFRHRFAGLVDSVWQQLCAECEDPPLFDLLYLSFKEVEHGAEKTRVSENVFKLFRGLWYLSGYVVSKKGAERLLSMLPVRGPVDLWINHKFSVLEALSASESVIAQRLDERSENSYSILPVLSKIGVLNSECPGLFRSQPLVKPVFAIGSANTGLTSLAMALSMLGYRCCSDLNDLPSSEKESLLRKNDKRVFDAYVNIGSLEGRLNDLAMLYPEARLILTIDGEPDAEADSVGTSKKDDIGLNGDSTGGQSQASARIRQWSDRILILPKRSASKWKLLCEFLSCVPPASSYPELSEHGQRQLYVAEYRTTQALVPSGQWLEADDSPWIAASGCRWNGVPSKWSEKSPSAFIGEPNNNSDNLDWFDDYRWLLRDDTFPGNVALFNPSNVLMGTGRPVVELTVRNEDMGVRRYSSGALTTHERFLFGRFEAIIKPPRVAGLVTGVFLHRDSPRQEIDIEFLGKDPRKMLVNVYYNPGGEGARFDYGYRGTPFLIDLWFDSTRDFHAYAIEWERDEIRWFVDNQLVHTRSNWSPTPIPHLPMRFHVNLWPSQSRELAGKIEEKLLPATAFLHSVRLSPTHLVDPVSQHIEA
jgi:GR25 family glycosyltransferase involved in LPS biosynthesis